MCFVKSDYDLLFNFRKVFVGINFEDLHAFDVAYVYYGFAMISAGIVVFAIGMPHTIPIIAMIVFQTCLAPPGTMLHCYAMGITNL